MERDCGYPWTREINMVFSRENFDRCFLKERKKERKKEEKFS